MRDGVPWWWGAGRTLKTAVCVDQKPAEIQNQLVFRLHCVTKHNQDTPAFDFPSVS